MSAEEFVPDDSILEGKVGVERIAEALRRHGYEIGNRVITSRDPGIDEVRNTLRRPKMPPGFTQWQLPFSFSGPTLFFLSVVEPGAVVPRHAHKQRDLFRVVVSGSILYNGIELKAGDWMFVPKGVEYSFSAGLNPGAIVYHCYG